MIKIDFCNYINDIYIINIMTLNIMHKIDRDEISQYDSNNNNNNLLSKQDLIYQTIGNTIGCMFCGYQIHINDYHTGIVTEFGIFKKVLPPGTHNYNVCTESVLIVKDVIVPEFHKGILYQDFNIIKILDKGIYSINPSLNQTIKFIKLTLIQENTIGIVTKNGIYSHEYNAGMHFINEANQETILIVNATIINEDEKGIRVNKGRFETLLEPGQYYENPILGIKIIVKKITIINEGYIGLKCLNGKIEKELSPGIYFENDFINEKIINVNMQIQTKQLHEQNIMSKDTVSIITHSILVYQITDAQKAIFKVENIDFSIRESIKVVTQQVLSENTLDDCIAKKQDLSFMIKERVESNCVEFGVKINRIDIKDIYINDDSIKEALSSSAIAKRMAESKYINAEAEVKAAEFMRQAADLLESKSAMHIRHMESIITICKQPNSKVHVVVNSEMMKIAEDKITKEIIKYSALSID